MKTSDASSTSPIALTAAQRRVVEHGHSHWVVSGPPAAGKSAVLVRWLEYDLERGREPDRVLLLAPDRRAARRLVRRMTSPDVVEDGDFQAAGYPGFAQRLVERFWGMVAAQFGIDAVEPTFLSFDVAQFTCLTEYRRAPGALQRLTIRDQSLVVQVLDTMNLAAANGLDLEEAWSRVALGRGLDPEHDIIRAALDLSRRFREQCLETGHLPFDLQIEAAAWLLQQDEVVNDLLNRFDILALDAFDEFVPVMAQRLAGLAGEFDRAIITYSPDGGIRWKLGASVHRTGEICQELVSGDSLFHEVCLRRSRSPSPVVHTGSADWLRELLVSDPGGPVDTPPPADGWALSVAERPDTMADRAVEAVSELIDTGLPPEEIVLLAPRIDPLVEAEIRRGCRRRAIPLRVDRHWRSLYDDPAARACLTALRCLAPESGRRPSPVEIADLLVSLTGRSAVDVQRFVRIIVDPRGSRLRPLNTIRAELPIPVEQLLQWVEETDEAAPITDHIESFADNVATDDDLAEACQSLISTARRIGEIGEIDGPDHHLFFDFVDSNVIASDGGGERPADAVLFTTPYAFLMGNRPVAVQCWLDVASPSWWDPPAALLSDPHALADAPTTYDDEERLRGEIMGRLIWNLATRCNDRIFALASQTGADGGLLDGPLLEGLQLLGVPQR